MAHHVEPMDVDVDNDFDNKENTYHLSNVLPCTEKGYEELDVSELNMKLRYSMTPASSPMSKSYTASLDNRNFDTDNSQNDSNENASLTRSLNSTMTKNDSVIKSLKSLPLQSLPTEQFIDGNGNASVIRQFDSTLSGDINNTVTISGTNDNDENLSLPSMSSSALHTPEATTPTKDISKDGGSPIIRGLKSVLNMFRSSQSPISSLEDDNITVKQEVLNPTGISIDENAKPQAVASTPIAAHRGISIDENAKPQAVASTPIAAHRGKDGNTSKRSSPYKDSMVFNDDLEKELNWNDETIIFSHEKIPIHKLFYQNTKSISGSKPTETDISTQNINIEDNFNSTVEYMDISYNESLIKERTMVELQQDRKHEISVAVESDNEFLDCETTFTKNESQILESKETKEKDSSSVANSQKTSKDISFTNDNYPAANPLALFDVSGVSFTDGVQKNDVTIPSDYSDYSKETNEILYELQKFEKKFASKEELTDENSNAHENFLEKVNQHQPETLEITSNIILENNKLECIIDTTESQDKQVENTPLQEQNDNTPPPVEPKTLDAHESKIETTENMESLVVSENIITNSQDPLQIIANQDNGNISQVICDVNTQSQDVLELVANQDNNGNVSQLVCDITIDPNPQIIEVDLKIPETAFVQDPNSTESQIKIASEQLESTPLQEQNDNITPHIEPKTLDIPKIKIETTENTESLVVSENIITNSQDPLQIITNQDNANISQVICDVNTQSQDILELVANQDNNGNVSQHFCDITIDPNPEIIEVNLKIPETAFVQDPNSTESQIKIASEQLESTPLQEQNDNITPHIEPKTLDTPEIKIETTENTENLVVSDNIITTSQDPLQTITNQDHDNISHVICDVTIDLNTPSQDVLELIANQYNNGNISQVVCDITLDPNLQIIEADLKVPETMFVQDPNSSESQIKVNSEQVKNTPLQEQNDNIMPHIEPKTLDAPESKIETTENTENLIVSDNIIITSQNPLQLITIQDNENISQVICRDVTKDPSQDVPELIANQFNNGNITQVVCDITIDPNPQIIEADLKILETTFVKDPNSTESKIKIDSDDTHLSQLVPESRLVYPTSLVQDIVPSEILSIRQEEIMPETLDILLTQKPVILLPIEECPKECIETVNSESLNETRNIIEQPKTANVIQIEKPSDIPLPDEDDIDNGFITGEVLSTVIAEIVPVMPPETLNVTKTMAELVNTEIIQKDLSHTVIEDKVGNNSTTLEVLNSTSAESAIVQFHEILGTANTEIKLNTTKTFDENPLEPLPESNIKNDIVPPEQDNIISIELRPQSLPGALKLTSDDYNVTETIDESFPKIITQTMMGDVMQEDLQSFNNMVAFKQTYEHVPNDITEIVNNSQCFTNAVIATVTKENVEQTQHIESMDNTMNKSLNQTRDLPDLVNQTVVITNENVQTLTGIDKMPKQQDLAFHSENVEIIAEVETPLKKKAVDTEDKNKDVSDSIIKMESIIVVKTTQQNNEPIDHINQSMITNLPNTNEYKSDVILENIPADNAFNNPDVELSDVQPTETIINTANVENIMEVDVTTVEEVIVSESKSPYVSLITDVDIVPQQIENTFEDIQNPLVNANAPSSPPISSRGYNFNFDEMDDPFDTKMKIRLSPPLDTSIKAKDPENEKTKSFEVPKRGNASRRKSQPVERKKTAAMKKKFNTTFDDNRAVKSSAIKIDTLMENLHIPNEEIKCDAEQPKQIEKLATLETTKPFDAIQTLQEEYNKSDGNEDLLGGSEENVEKSEKLLVTSEENVFSVDSLATVSNDTKTTSSSEQSTYYSAGTSSTDSLKCKNVFNLPEIDDVNFNPFTTKSKMRQSPPPELEAESPFVTKTKIKSSPDSSMIVSSQLNANSTLTTEESKPAQQFQKNYAEDKTETELMEKDTSNISSTTSLKTMNHLNLTTCEVKTEDEDTIEGPFLEAEDIIDKMSGFDSDNVDVVQVNDVPVQEAEDNLQDGELFIDAEAYEFLLNQTANVVADSGKESLFLKFDPLFAKRISSVGVLEALSKVQRRQSTPTKPARPPLRNEVSPIAGPSALNVTYDGNANISQESNEDVNITVSKPMMVVTPAVNPAVTPRNKSVTPTRSNRRSVTFTSPAMAVIDRLLSMSSNNSFMGQDTTLTQANREQTEADLALTQLRELLAEKELTVYNLRFESKELQDRLSTMESQVRILEADSQERLKKINELNEHLAQITKSNKSMEAVVEEYERTIASLIAGTEQDKKCNAEERIRLINERDEQTAHLASMEVSFSDLHSKYEKSKQVIFACKTNEEICKKSIKEFEENLTKMQSNYEMLKQHATSKLNHANQELEKLNRAHESEVVKLNAMIKRKEMHCTSLEESLAQKTKANEELTAICDELINKVG